MPRARFLALVLFGCIAASCIVFHLAGAKAFAAAGTKASAPARSGAAFDLADPLLLRGLEWRSIGPTLGGRVTAVSGVVGQPSVYYFGGTGSGVWKSADNGVSWRPIADGQLGTGSVGAIAVSESDPNVIYVGMGEACIRGNVSHGDGVYKSTDAGKTWTHVGLADARQIGKIRVHPRDPDLVYVAALGHAFGPNHERGVFRSRDGGATWKNVLSVNDSTGAVDLALDPRNARILYAGCWQAVRTPWSLESGGRGSALYKSSDGGDTWSRLTGEGLPKGLWGRVGVAVSPVISDRLWAVIEADEGGVFRSDDAGRTWTRVNQDRRLRQRAWYYTHVVADPKNADVMYVLNVQIMRSKDGGRTFTPIGEPHGDNHDLWIDPDDPQRMIEGNDGGVVVSLDGGTSWSRQDNQPTAQFYHVITDSQFPYRVYGAQQDRGTVSIASRTTGYGIGATDGYDVGGCESGYIAPRPDGSVVYAGCYDGYIGHYDVRTREERDVSVYPENPMGWGAEGMKYRFQWTFPIVLSPHDPNTLYAGGNVLFKSTNDGQSWKAISPDLTRNDASKLVPSGGPITKDNTSVEYYCTIFAVAESRPEKGVIWVGSDDGRVHVTRDAGTRWDDVTPRDLPEWSMISQIDPSPTTPGTAYLAANHYKQDDYRPFAYVTTDYGRSWRRITAGLPGNSFVRVVRVDPVKKGLLYCGTETGIYFSPDNGTRWWPLRLGSPGAADAEKAALARAHARAVPADAGTTIAEVEPRGLFPVVPVTDLVIKGNDVVVSTQGRAFWILDDVSPLRQLGPSVTAGHVHLFAPAPSPLFGGPVGAGPGQNPPRGVLFYYWLEDDLKEKDDVTLEILDPAGKLIRKLSSKGDENAEGGEGVGGGGEGEGGGFGRGAAAKLPARAGLNRFAWNFRYPDATRFKGLIMWGGSTSGPEVVPGRYQARITAAGTSRTVAFEVTPDPRLAMSQADYGRRFDFLLQVHEKLSETHEAVMRIRDLRDQIKAAVERARAATKDTTIAAGARGLTDKLTRIEEALYQTKNASSQDPLNYPIRLNNKLAALTGVVESATAPPTDQSYEVLKDISARIDVELGRLRALIAGDLATFNRMVRDQNVPAVVVKEKKESAATGAGGTP